MRSKKFQGASDLKVCVMGDEDTVTGFLMTGIGQRDGQGRVNFLVVGPRTTVAEVEETFKTYVKRTDVGVILINQHVADMIRHLVDLHHEPIPTILEIPSKDKPYDPAKDSVMQRVKVFFGGQLPGNWD